ncbi:MAG: hypothetical protein PHH07_06770 [Candidatus Cloacimonetes bacterium]|nr:hypothetical protein [Candidatus Cloacimonadota bacterium]
MTAAPMANPLQLHPMSPHLATFNPHQVTATVTSLATARSCGHHHHVTTNSW